MVDVNPTDRKLFETSLLKEAKYTKKNLNLDSYNLVTIFIYKYLIDEFLNQTAFYSNVCVLNHFGISDKLKISI